MVVSISKWGNSQGVRLPKQLLEQLHATVGTSVEVEIYNNSLILTPVVSPKEYSIENLVREIPADYQPTEVDWGKPKGGEQW